MKAMHWMMYTLLGITLLLTACVDDDKDLSQPKEPEKTTDLIILFMFRISHSFCL